MKDEEMADKHAEEYVMREDIITENDRVPFDNGYGFQTVDFEKEVKKGYKDGFLAGLKAGRPQWHEIESKVTPKREISKQYMPKNKKKVLLKYHFSGDNEIHISDGYYDAYDFEFYIANNPKCRIVCVIAWKEIE